MGLGVNTAVMTVEVQQTYRSAWKLAYNPVPCLSTSISPAAQMVLCIQGPALISKQGRRSITRGRGPSTRAHGDLWRSSTTKNSQRSKKHASGKLPLRTYRKTKRSIWFQQITE